MSFSTTIHDVADPISHERVSVRFESGNLVEKSSSLSGDRDRNIDGSAWWYLPGLYDADAHMPLVHSGLRDSDRAAALTGGVTRVNVALQWQDIVDLDLRSLIQDITRWTLPRIVPILSVHSDLDSTGFDTWLAINAEVLRELLLPPVCKLYSYGEGFLRNLETVFEAGMLPIVYCREFDDVAIVRANARGPVHFRHAMTAELVREMKKLPDATLQTSPHFLLPISDDVRAKLHVLPPVADAETRNAFLPLVMDEIDLFVTDHNAPPFTTQEGPGLQVQQEFLPALLTLSELQGWSLRDVLHKATTAPAQLFGIPHNAGDFTIVDPTARHTSGLWQPRQTADRAPFAGLPLNGRVVAIGNHDAVALL